EGGGKWYVHVNDGKRVIVTADPPTDGQVAGTTRVGFDTFQRLIGGHVTPAQTMREQLAEVNGDIHPTVMLGRWIERAQGRDDAEMARERGQRDIQARRTGSWGAAVDGNGRGRSEQVS